MKYAVQLEETFSHKRNIWSCSSCRTCRSCTNNDYL